MLSEVKSDQERHMLYGITYVQNVQKKKKKMTQQKQNNGHCQDLGIEEIGKHWSNVHRLGFKINMNKC